MRHSKQVGTEGRRIHGGGWSVGTAHHSVQVLLVNTQGPLPTCPAQWIIHLTLPAV